MRPIELEKWSCSKISLMRINYVHFNGSQMDHMQMNPPNVVLNHCSLVRDKSSIGSTLVSGEYEIIVVVGSTSSL